MHESDGELVNTNSGKCLDDTGHGGSGTRVQIWTCDDTSNQQWGHVALDFAPRLGLLLEATAVGLVETLPPATAASRPAVDGPCQSRDISSLRGFQPGERA